jgi:hypothetical protein
MLPLTWLPARSLGAAGATAQAGMVAGIWPVNSVPARSRSVEPLRKGLPRAEATGFRLGHTNCVEREGRIPTV